MNGCFAEIKSFNDFYALTEDLDSKKKGDLFELLTWYLFKIDPRLNNNLQEIWLYNDIPDEIRIELSLPSKDKGIDLLAKIDDEYYAIQCKFRQNPLMVVNWAELSTFFGLSFGMSDQIKRGFLVTNTYELCDEVIQSNKVEPIYGDFINDLDGDFFENIRQLITKHSFTINHIKHPYAYQRKCIISALVHYLEEKRGTIEMACGTGKTLTSYWIESKLLNKKSIVFVPSLQLLSQFYSDWVKQAHAEKKKVNFLLVGSDADVDEETKYKSNGIILYTNPTDIRKHVEKVKEKLVIICTYQSSDKLIEASKDIIYDFAIFDEAHKTVGQTNKFSLALFNKNIAVKHRLFMTATPKIFVGGVESDDIISMDDENIYGKQFFTYNTGSAIKNKLLCDYQIVSIYCTDKMIEKEIKNKKLVKYKDEFIDKEADYLATILIILKKFHDGTCHHMITYHNTVERSKKFAKFLKIINDLLYDQPIHIDHMSGTSSMNKRNRIIRNFMNQEKSILCTSRVLNEGVNIPIIDSICFVDKRESTIDIIQCIGRCLRLHDKKQIAHIIVPIFIENINEDNFDKNAFGSIIRILKSMKNTDDGIISYFKMKTYGSSSNARCVCINEYYDEELFSEEIDLDKWEESIQDQVWKITDNFDYRYNQLYKFVQKHDRLPKKNSLDDYERSLATWCSERRQYNLKGTLQQYQIDKLNKITHWYWEKDWFNDNLELLKKYISKNNKLPFKSNENKKYKSVSQWCINIRQKYKQGKLSQYRINELNKIPIWFWKRKDPFDDNLKLLKDYVNKHNRLSSESNEDDKKLGNWCHNMRHYYKHNKLTERQISELNKVPYWYWKKEKSNFDDTLKLLKDYVNENHKIPSTDDKIKNYKMLGSWCANIRQKYKLNKLTQNEIDKLNQITGWFWKKEDNFNEKVQQLKEYVNKYNKLPSSHEKNDQHRVLGKWCQRQRYNYRKGNLSKKRIHNLESVSGWYWKIKNTSTKPKTFDERYNELKKFIDENKKLPNSRSEDQNEKSLGKWIGHQKTAYSNGKLTKERIKLLNSIPNWYWPSKSSKKKSVNTKRYSGSKTANKRV